MRSSTVFLQNRADNVIPFIGSEGLIRVSGHPPPANDSQPPKASKGRKKAEKKRKG